MATCAGRPVKPLNMDTGPIAELAGELRRLREKAGLTYRELSARTNRVLSTLTTAAGGKRLPSWPVVHDWIVACDGDEEFVLSLYAQACAAAGRPAPVHHPAGTLPPDPAVATTAAEFVAAMRLLLSYAGNPSLRTLNRASGGRLPPSTVCEVLRRDSLPRLELVLDFVTACGLGREEAGKWEHSWAVISSRDLPAKSAARKRRRPLLAAHLVGGSCLALIVGLIFSIVLALMVGHVIGRAASSPAVSQRLDDRLDRALAALNASQPPGPRPPDMAMAAQSPAQTGDETYTLAAEEFMSGALGSGWDTPAGQSPPGVVYLGDFGQGPVLILTGLPVGTSVGLLTDISGQSYRRCVSAGHWSSAANGAAAIPPTTRQVCVITAGLPGQAALMTMRERARQVTLRVTTWSMRMTEGLRTGGQSLATCAGRVLSR